MKKPKKILKKKTIRQNAQRVLSFVLTLSLISLPFLSLPGMQKTASAATKTYVSNIILKSTSKSGDYTGLPSGSTIVKHDMNCDAGGKYLYVAYQTTTDTSKAIHGLIFSGSKKNSISYQGCTYYPIATTGSDSGGDFNYGASGDYIYLYATTNENAGPAITSLNCYCDEKNHPKSNAARVRNTSGYVQDANDGSHGAYIYLTYTTDIDSSTTEKDCYIYNSPDKIPTSVELFKQLLTQNRTLRNWSAIANAINTGNQDEDNDGKNYFLDPTGTLYNTGSPKAAAKAINNSLADQFSESQQPTFYIKGSGGGVIFTNLHFVDTDKYLTTNADGVKKGDSVDSLEAKGIKVSRGTPEYSAVDTLENNTASEAKISSSYSNTTGSNYTTTVSQTNAKSLTSSTSIEVSQGYSIPFVGEGSVTVTQTIDFEVSSSNTKENSSGTIKEETSSSGVEVTVPAHTTCSIMKQKYTSDVTVSYQNAVIAAYDVYILKGNTYYHFTGTSDGHSTYSSAGKNVYYRAVTRPAAGLTPDIRIDSNNTTEGIVNWSDVMKYHPAAARAVYELNRNIAVAPYGGSLTMTMYQIYYTAAAFQPMYKLKNLEPTKTNINLDAVSTLNLDTIPIKATDKDQVAWYGFQAQTDGNWKVVNGPATIQKDHSGSDILKPTGIGRVSLQYVPENISAEKKETDLTSKLLTVNISCKKHNYKTTIQKATLKKDGKITGVCTICGAKMPEKVIARPAKLTLAKTTCTYNGKTQKPAVTIKDSKGKTIPASNYTVTYSDGKNVGSQKAVVKFKGNYSGSATLAYQINPSGTTAKKPAASKKAFTAKWTKVSAKMAKARISGYEVQYSTSSKFKNAKTKKVSGYGKTSLKVSNLKGKTTYYVRVRTTMKVSKKSYSSAWSKTQHVKTK